MRMMIYAQDGLGLGHMRRTTSIASELIKVQPDAIVLTVEDSPIGNFFRTSPNHDYVKLPSIEKIRPGDWRGVNLPLRFEDIRALREQLIRSVVLNFRPDILLVDHMPHGAMGELRPALEALRKLVPEARVVLGLRDIIDAPEIVRRRWQVEGAYEAMQRFYDLVLVYGSRDVFDLAREYLLPQDVGGKVRYCGYLCTPARARYPERIRAQYTNGTGADTKLVVVTAGGGADAYPMMRAVLDVLPALRAREQIALVIIAGPFMSSPERRDLQSRAAELKAHFRITVSDPLSYIEAADLVITRAGYNTTMEVLRAATPALLIPRPGPSAEQRTRARLFQERGWVDMLDPDDVSTDALVEAIARGLRRGPKVRALPGPDLGGLSAAVEQLVSVVRTVGLEQRLAPTAE
jgi:predicted glycosyltransferase